MTDTADFFDEMAPRYDSDLVELGWDPVALLEDWPFVAPAGAAVLDAGCGTGAVLDHFAGANRALAGFDVSPRLVHFARHRRPLRLPPRPNLPSRLPPKPAQRRLRRPVLSRSRKSRPGCGRSIRPNAP